MDNQSTEMSSFPLNCTNIPDRDELPSSQGREQQEQSSTFERRSLQKGLFAYLRENYVYKRNERLYTESSWWEQIMQFVGTKVK